MEEKKTLIEKTLIDCRDVALGYEGKALSRHLSFQVHSGDYLCIVGENGTGKSTLLKVLLSLLKPMEGQVVMDRTLKAGAIGYLPQQTRAQRDFPATVYEVVLSGFLSELSGGQQQRVLLSRALCAAGELLILDEPVTGLDPEAAHDMYRTLSYLNRTEGIAIVMVTHDLQNALKYATHILHAGHKGWFFGTAAEFAASPYGKKLGGDGE